MKEREFAKKNEANRIRISEVSKKKEKSEILKILKILNFKILIAKMDRAPFKTPSLVKKRSKSDENCKS